MIVFVTGFFVCFIVDFLLLCLLFCFAFVFCLFGMGLFFLVLILRINLALAF